VELAYTEHMWIKCTVLTCISRRGPFQFSCSFKYNTSSVVLNSFLCYHQFLTPLQHSFVYTKYGIWSCFMLLIFTDYMDVPLLKFKESFNKEFYKCVEIVDHKTEFAWSLVSFAGLFVFISCNIYLSQFSTMSWSLFLERDRNMRYVVLVSNPKA
jgi:hypothetical protein